MARQGLNTDKVVAEALQLVDEKGFEALSLAEVAARLGVKVPSLYKHVDGLDDLRTRLFRLVNDEFFHALETATEEEQGRDAVIAFARAYHEYVTTRGGRFEVTAFGRGGKIDPTVRFFALLERLVSGCGVPPAELNDATFALAATMRGVGQLRKLGIYGDLDTAARVFHFMIDAILDGYAEGPRPSAG